MAAKGIMHTGEIALTPEPGPTPQEIAILKAVVDEGAKAGVQINVHAVSTPALVAGIDAGARRGVEEKWADRAYSGFVRAASKVLPLAKVIDSSPYDRTMRKFHNYMKDTPQFQRDTEGQLQMIFKPFSSWMVLTDAVSHACISGQHAFVDTLLVPLANCRLPHFAPYEILRASAPFAAAEQ